MRIAVARYAQRSRRYAPIAITMDRVGSAGPLSGDLPAGGLDVAWRAGPEADAGLDSPVVAVAWPRGRVTRTAFEWVCGQVVAAVGKDCEGLAIDLHGAALVDGFEDGEGELLRRIRHAAPHAPISVTLDFHSDLSAAIVEFGNIITGYPTYPRADTFRACESAPRMLLRIQRDPRQPCLPLG